MIINDQFKYIYLYSRLRALNLDSRREKSLKPDLKVRIKSITRLAKI